MSRSRNPCLLKTVGCVVLLLCVVMFNETSSRPATTASSVLDGSALEFLLKLDVDERKRLLELNIMDTVLRLLMDWYAPVEAKNELCRNHSLVYKDAVVNKTMWALKMFDSSTKVPNSFLEGNIRHLGDFDECLDVHVELDHEAFSHIRDQTFDGEHCLVTFAGSTSQNSTNDINLFLTLLTGNIPVDKVQNVKTNDLSLNTALGAIIPQWGLCIPSSCSAEDVQIHLQKKFGESIMVIVNPQTCSVKKQTSFAAKDWGMIAFLTLFAVLIIASTGYDLFLLRSKDQTKGPLSIYFVAFSFYSNGKRLLSTTSSAETMGCINGIRFLSMAWVVLGHKYYSIIMSPVSNALQFLDFPKHWYNMTLLNGFVAVDTFLFLSGFLLVFVFLKEVERTKSFKILHFYIYRYLRLTPVFLVIIGFNATLYYYLGSGPMWETVAGATRETCSSNWWKSLTYLNNYPFLADYGNPAECLTQAWYLYVDMQLYWLSPLFLYPLWKWPRYGLIGLGFAIAGSIAIPFTITYTKNLPWTTDYFTASNFMDFMEYIYVATYSRATPYFVGAVAGYILHQHRKKSFKIPKALIYLGWTMSTAVCLSVIFGLSVYYQEDHVYNPLEAAFYASFHRFAWAVGIGWVIFACVTGHGGPVNTLLSWKLFQPLSRLTYCAYLTHFMVLSYEMGTVRSTIHYSSYSVVISYIGNLLLVLAVSALFTLTFESPILIIEKALLRKGNGNRTSPNVKKETGSESNGRTNNAFTSEESNETRRL